MLSKLHYIRHPKWWDMVCGTSLFDGCDNAFDAKIASELLNAKI